MESIDPWNALSVTQLVQQLNKYTIDDTPRRIEKSDLNISTSEYASSTVEDTFPSHPPSGYGSATEANTSAEDVRMMEALNATISQEWVGTPASFVRGEATAPDSAMVNAALKDMNNSFKVNESFKAARARLPNQRTALRRSKRQENKVALRISSRLAAKKSNN